MLQKGNPPLRRRLNKRLLLRSNNNFVLLIERSLVIHLGTGNDFVWSFVWFGLHLKESRILIQMFIFLLWAH